MSSKGRPSYFDTFEPNRVAPGEAINRLEIIRRLAHYLQVPQRFGTRLMMAFEDVIKDAMLHGEGIRLGDVGTLTLQKHKNEYYTGFGRHEKRKILYKYDWAPTAEAKRFLQKVSELDKKGELDDYFSNPEDYEL